MKILILTPLEIINDPIIGEFIRPLLGEKFEFKWRIDATAQPANNLLADPNLCVFEGECTEKVVDEIAVDGRFKVLQRETDKDDLPSGQEINALRQYLQTNGVSGQDLGLLIAANATRSEQAQIILLWLRDRPKAEVVRRDFVAAAASEIERPPMVRIFGREIPLSSQWTWDHIIKPLVKLFRG